MFGIRFIKIQPTVHVLEYKKGKVIREGTGLSFFYYAPTTSLVAVPVASADVPFIFNEITADFQEITLQGQATYRIADPHKIAALLNFTLDPTGRGYISDDPGKLPLRLTNVLKVFIRREIQSLPLQEALLASERLVRAVLEGAPAVPELKSFGIEILGLSILSIKPTPDTARALEAETREQLLKRSDEAIYARRNAAVEQERAIKENELSTEIAVEQKKRQIREAQMDAELAVQEKKHQVQEADMAARIALEEKNKSLVVLRAENAKQDSDSRAYAAGVLFKAFADLDPKILTALSTVGMQPDQRIAMAFQELAQKAEKIGQLNVSPDLLAELLKSRAK